MIVALPGYLCYNLSVVHNTYTTQVLQEKIEQQSIVRPEKIIAYFQLYAQRTRVDKAKILP